jgi:hypothetical protein
MSKSQSLMLPVQVKPPQPPKPTKRDIIEAMARAVLEDRQKNNAAIQKQIDKIDAKLKRASVKHLRRAFTKVETKLSTGGEYDRVNQCYQPCVERKVVVLLKDHPDLKEMIDAIKALQAQQEDEGWGALEGIKKQLSSHSADRSVIVNGLLGKFRKELLEQGKAMLKSPTPADQASAITV